MVGGSKPEPVLRKTSGADRAWTVVLVELHFFRFLGIFTVCSTFTRIEPLWAGAFYPCVHDCQRDWLEETVTMSSVSNLTTTDGPLWDSAENHGPVVSVISWLLIVALFLTISTRIATRWAVVRQIRSDDITIITELVRDY